jgi:nitronate monooxygenase
MWKNNRVRNLLKIEYPIIQAPMAGGATTPQLVATVSNSGALGSLAAALQTPEQTRRDIREIRHLTDRPFAVNMFIPVEFEISREKIERMTRLLDRYRAEMNIPLSPEPSVLGASFEEQIMVIIEEKPPVFSFTFGALSSEWIKPLKEAGITLIGTATTVEEGLELEHRGIDIVVGQGSEAGGHRGTFMGPVSKAMIGTMALIPQLVDNLNIPVVASGGIMDGRGVLAALALGAEGAQLGTAFLTTLESGIQSRYKDALIHSSEQDTVLTKTFSGRYARGLNNRYISEMTPYEDDIPAFPIPNSLTRDIRVAAVQQGKTEFLPMWAGQASRLCKAVPAAKLVAEIVQEVEELTGKLGN